MRKGALLLSAGRLGANACKTDGSTFVKASKKYNLNPKRKATLRICGVAF